MIFSCNNIIITLKFVKSYKIRKPNILSSRECLLNSISAIHYLGSGVKQKNLMLDYDTLTMLYVGIGQSAQIQRDETFREFGYVNCCVKRISHIIRTVCSTGILYMKQNYWWYINPAKLLENIVSLVLYDKDELYFEVHDIVIT